MKNIYIGTGSHIFSSNYSVVIIGRFPRSETTKAHKKALPYIL